MKVIARQIEQAKSKQLSQDLNSILKHWQWDNQPITTSQEFLTWMTPWINGRIKEHQELKEFLKKKKVKSLSELL